MKAHCIGICGAGMSAVARLLQQKSYEVTGSDQGFYPPVSDYVAKLGIETYSGYSPDNIADDVDVIVIGKNANLVPETNSEVAHAFKQYKHKIKSYPEVINGLIGDRHSVVVAGSYGKSTVTSLMSWCLIHAGKDPSYMIGALPKGFEYTSHLGTGTQFILEGDEYPSANWDDRSKFLHYKPQTVLLTSASHDHVNIYPTLTDYHAPFEKLLAQLQNNSGKLVACIDQPDSKDFYDSFDGQKTSYGINPDADWSATNIVFGEITKADITNNGQHVISIKTQLLGQHNIQNIVAVAAVLLGQNMLTVGEFADAVNSFEGLVRRLDRKVPKNCPVHVYEGFGSSYDKARAAIQAMKLHFRDSRLVLLFEPHTFTWRNRNAIDQYETAFDGSDTVWIYQPPSQGSATHAQVSLDEIIEKTSVSHDDVRIFEGNTVGDVIADLQKNDVLLLLSSGNFDGLQNQLIDQIEQKHV